MAEKLGLAAAVFSYLAKNGMLDDPKPMKVGDIVFIKQGRKKLRCQVTHLSPRKRRKVA